MSGKPQKTSALNFNPWFSALIGLSAGFLICWYSMVRPMGVHLAQREKALLEWDQINRQERQAIANIKTISTEEIRKWVSTLDEQNSRFNEIQSRLHKQEVSLISPGTVHLWISLIFVLGMAGFAIWMIRDSNADAARTLQSAVAVLPSLREALKDKQMALAASASNTVRLEESNPGQSRALLTNRLTGKVKRYLEDKEYGFIAPDDGSIELFFHKNNVKPSGSKGIAEGISVSFRLGKDRIGRSLAEDIEVG
jgi:CspA family cold shock protein